MEHQIIANNYLLFRLNWIFRQFSGNKNIKIKFNIIRFSSFVIILLVSLYFNFPIKLYFHSISVYCKILNVLIEWIHFTVIAILCTRFACLMSFQVTDHLEHLILRVRVVAKKGVNAFLISYLLPTRNLADWMPLSLNMCIKTKLRLFL